MKKLYRFSILGVLVFIALIAFEVLNYSTTHVALLDLIGSALKIFGITWAAILALSFCAIDFAGVARLFTPPEDLRHEPLRTKVLLGAWLLCATVNAVLIWWGITVAIRNNISIGVEITGIPATFIPIFLAFMVWIVRIIIIGTMALLGERLFIRPIAPPSNGIRRISPKTVGAIRKYPVNRKE